MRKYFSGPLGKSAVILGVSYLFLEFGIAYLPPLIGIASGPVPDSVLLQYMVTVAIGILLWVSFNEALWKEFKEYHNIWRDIESNHYVLAKT